MHLVVIIIIAYQKLMKSWKNSVIAPGYNRENYQWNWPSQRCNHSCHRKIPRESEWQRSEWRNITWVSICNHGKENVKNNNSCHGKSYAWHRKMERIIWFPITWKYLCRYEWWILSWTLFKSTDEAFTDEAAKQGDCTLQYCQQQDCKSVRLDIFIYFYLPVFW